MADDLLSAGPEAPHKRPSITHRKKTMNEPQQQALAHSNPAVTRCIITLCIIATLSATVSYTLVASPAWISHFDQGGDRYPRTTGLMIEILRIALYTSCLWYCGILSGRLGELLHSKTFSNFLIFSSQLATIFLCALFTYKIIEHHSNGWKSNAKFTAGLSFDELAMTSTTYLYFLPYSLVVFGIFAPLMGGVFFYSSGADILRIHRDKAALLSGIDSDWESVASDGFFHFRNDIIRVMINYMQFLTFSGLILSFELSLGPIVNLDEANKTILLYWAVITACPCFVCMSFFELYNCHSLIALSSPCEKVYAKFVKGNRLRRFVRDLFTFSPIPFLSMISVAALTVVVAIKMIRGRLELISEVFS